MKKREITNNEMEHLFNKVTEQTPLISEEQVYKLLNDFPTVSSGSSFKRFFQNHLNSWMTGVIVASTVALSALWVYTNKEADKPTTQVAQQENVDLTISALSGEEVIDSKPSKIAIVSTEATADKSIVGANKEITQNTAHEDNTEEVSPAKKSSPPNKLELIDSLSDVYKYFDKQPQLFYIQAKRDTTIICIEGTTIKIKANSFKSESTGKEISGIVQIAVKEYYKLSDMLLNNLSTTSGDRIIETGGMIHIAAMAENENCIIKPGREIEIGFPYSEKKDDMVLFNGERTNDGIDWKLSKATDIVATARMEIAIMTEPEAYFIVEEMPDFPGGSAELKKYIEQNTRYPFSALKDKIEGTVSVSCVIDRTGFVTDISISKGINSALDKAAYYLVSNMPKWKPGRQGGKSVSVAYTISVPFSATWEKLTQEEKNQAKIFEKEIENEKVVYKKTYRNYKEKFEDKVNDENLNSIRVSDINRYLLSASQFGWINCDRFSNDNRDKTDFFVQPNEPNSTNIQLVFHSLKAIIPGQRQSNGFKFIKVPIGEKVTIIAFKTVNDKIFLAVHETEITDKEVTDLNFRPVTMELLREEMEKLNKSIQ